MLQPGQIDERLEGRAGLALRRDGAVKLAFAIVATPTSARIAPLGSSATTAPWETPNLLPFLASSWSARCSAARMEIVTSVVVTTRSWSDRTDRVGQHVHHIVRGVIDRAGADLSRWTRAGLAQGDALAIASVMWPSCAMRVMTCAGAFGRAFGVAFARELARRLSSAPASRRPRRCVTALAPWP